ncbi:MAG: hypothetical protein CUN55_07990 [Phototrophicales bacterium]|nr:MAG: hypothetical protein CUN55_07990 [Phototrophicales bacterium]
MSEKHTVSTDIDYAAVLENLGDGVLIFNAADQLIYDNRVARQILGSNMVVLRQKGWSALAILINRDLPEDLIAEDLRAKALRQTEPVRFRLMLGNAYIPCWLSAVHQENQSPLTIVSIEQADWTPISQFLSHLQKEGMPAVEDTLGHAKFMIQIAKRANEKTKVTQLSGQMLRFSELIQEEMTRFQLLIKQLQRLELIQTDQIRKIVSAQAKPINLEEFFEDLMEELAEEHAKQENDGDLRERFTFDIPSNLVVNASKSHLETIMRDVIDNAIRYSKPNTPINITAFATNKGKNVQINVTDNGYGIRENDHDRVFTAFQRGRQPHVIAESGVGLSLALCKSELAAMQGNIWFISEEGAGTTFSIKLPAALTQSEKPLEETKSAAEDSSNDQQKAETSAEEEKTPSTDTSVEPSSES